MSYKVFSISPFDRQLKRLVKKYPSLVKEFTTLVDGLENNPVQGTALGNNCYKIRIAISSKNKGKRGGGRVVTNVVVYEETVYLLTIYDKSVKTDLTDKELKSLLALVPK